VGELSVYVEKYLGHWLAFLLPTILVGFWTRVQGISILSRGTPHERLALGTSTAPP